MGGESGVVIRVFSFLSVLLLKGLCGSLALSGNLYGEGGWTPDVNEVN